MADGKVRFIPATMPVETFRALCTINGGEPIEKLDEIAPVVPDDAPPTELRTDLPPPVVAKPPEPKPAEGSEPQPAAETANPREAAKTVALAAISKVCAQCHTGPRSKGDTMIFTGPGTLNQNAPWNEVKKAIDEGKMPPRNARIRLTPDEQKAIRTWIGG